MNVVPGPGGGRRLDRAVARRRRRTTAACPHPTILAACALLGVDEVYAVGGAQAIAMFAYGAGPVPPGRPGHRTGQHLRRRPPSGCSRARIGIDSEAGPTEIAVLADDTADAAYVAADLISQAEHDAARGQRAGHASRAAGRRRRGRARASRCARPGTPSGSATALAGQQSAIVLVDDLEQGLAVVDAYAAEHLEIQTEDAAAVAARVRNAGRDLRRPLRPGVAGRLLRRLQPRAADRRLRLPLLGPVGAGVPQVGARRRLRPRRAGRGRPTTWSTLAEAEDLPAHGAAVARPVRADDRAVTSPLPLREELRRPRAVRRARSSTCRSSSTSTRTRTRRRAARGRRHRARRWPTAAREPQPLPRPRVHRAARPPSRRT